MIRLNEFVSHVAASIKSDGIKKHVNLPRKALYVSDDDGNTRVFYIKSTNKDVQYTIDDVKVILAAAMRTMYELIQSGEKVQFRDFGTFEAKYRLPRRSKHPCTGEQIVIPGRYIVKYIPGNRMKVAARVYEKLQEGIQEPQEDLFDESIYLPDDEDQDEHDEPDGLELEIGGVDDDGVGSED